MVKGGVKKCLEMILIDKFLSRNQIVEVIEDFYRVKLPTYEEPNNSEGISDLPFQTSIKDQIETKIKKIETRPFKYHNSFTRRYLGIGSKLDPHTDIGLRDLTVSICLYDNIEWPLKIQNGGSPLEVTLQPGQGVFFDAKKFVHWRDINTTDKDAMYLFYHWTLTEDVK